MASSSQVKNVIFSLQKFVRRHFILVLIGIAGLLVLAFPAKVLSQANGPSMFFNYTDINIGLDQCKQEAYTKIANALEIAATAQVSGVIEASENGVFGSGSGGHSAAVLCLPDNKIAVAVAAGPNQERNTAIANYLLQGF